MEIKLFGLMNFPDSGHETKEQSCHKMIMQEEKL